jgi:RNA polymerase sigma-70 factor, ECF subfamily
MWARLAELYGALAQLAPSPVVALDHAATVGFAFGARAGLDLLAPLLSGPALVRYQPLHATHAELLRRTGDLADAARAYERAIALSSNTIERAELARRRDALEV